MSNAPGAPIQPPQRANRPLLLPIILAAVLVIFIVLTFVVFFYKNANDWRPVPTHTPTLNLTQAGEATAFAGSMTPLPGSAPTQAATLAATQAATSIATDASSATGAATAAATAPATPAS